MDASALEIGKLLVTLAALAAIYMKIRTAVREISGKGEPREIVNNPLVTEARPRFATMDDIGNVETRLSKLERRLEHQMNDNRQSLKDIEEGVDDLRDRMDDRLLRLTDGMHEISRAIGRLEGS